MCQLSFCVGKKCTLSILLIKFYCGRPFDCLKAIRSDCFLFHSISTLRELHVTTKKVHKLAARWRSCQDQGVYFGLKSLFERRRHYGTLDGVDHLVEVHMCLESVMTIDHIKLCVKIHLTQCMLTSHPHGLIRASHSFPN